MSNTKKVLKYFFVSGLTLSFENAPAPKDITKKKSKTKTSIVINIPILLSILLLIILVYFNNFHDILS